MSDTQARLDAIRGALRTADNASPGYPAWSEAMYALDALAAELERVTAALRRIADENDPLLGIGSEMEFAQETLAGGARAAKENQ
jgi:hypothetical protein